MSWLAVLRALTAFLSEVATSVRERRLLKAGRAEAVAEILSDATKALQTARDAGERVRAELRAHPERLLDDDGFRRD
ncbi:hypothetical protein J0X15_12395 [Roseibium sp. CAU 1637]|uniref:Uncharacterized protein n=1 Tax=Roseibium limicola TaxID=2816037 RepID=A0A939J5P0_9HYPH|nr:hypothetical protein [Roseibium limicola]MBO0346025.1 hypothetical protein [Roseibium limicola]